MIATGDSSISLAGSAGIPSLRVRRVVAAVLADAGRGAEVSVTFLGLTAMQALNRDQLDRDYPTDVIAFELPQPDGRLVGDIYLCPGLAARHARAHGISREEEIERLLIHGTLHVLGHEHPEGGAREESPMWLLQERLLGEVRR